jgi:hypothetical protein
MSKQRVTVVIAVLLALAILYPVVLFAWGLITGSVGR